MYRFSLARRPRLFCHVLPKAHRLTGFTKPVVAPLSPSTERTTISGPSGLRKATRNTLGSSRSGDERTLHPTPPKLDGQAEARLVAMRLGEPPKGYGKWTLQLLADQLVKLEVVESICPETVRKTLKKIA
ncbi:helix-turn-helix domain-containing protein [Planctomycetes bacterium Pan216]|uniref:helix-turn-helix domain-containing protein n=1 Tax=Kolteria novifilia TaxID=2527975 RepID=UPI0011A58DAC